MTSPPVLFVTGCQKYKSTLLTALQRFQHSAWILVGVLGGATETTFDPETRILSLAVSDTYEDLPAKIWAAVDWILKQWPTTPGIFKTDDDIFVDANLLAMTIQAQQARQYWGFRVGMCRASEVHPWRIQMRFVDKTLKPRHQQAIYCYGHGYWLGAQAVRVVQAAQKDYAESCLEDVCTGYVLNQKKILPKEIRVPYEERLRTSGQNESPQ